MNSYDVRFWDIKKGTDTAKGRWRVRWGVAGRPHCKSFPARQTAEGFLAAYRQDLGSVPLSVLIDGGQHADAGRAGT